MAQENPSAAVESSLEAEGEDWETITEGVRRRIIPSDKHVLIVPEDPAQAQRRLWREHITTLPDEEWARYVLTLHGSKGLHRADALSRARKYVREYPDSDKYNSHLEWAISRDTTELLEEVINKSGNYDEGHKNGVVFDPNIVSSSQTALYHAVSRDKIHNIRLLLDCGADPNIYSVHGNSNNDDPWQTPLHCAARGWHLDSIKLLLERGANINALSLLNGETPLHHAILAARFWAQKYNWEDLKWTIECLTNAGADVNIRDDNSHAPLDTLLAIADDHQNVDLHHIAKPILEAGADINASGLYGNSSFMLAAALERTSSIFRLLLRSGKAAIDRQNEDGDTALHFLSQRGALEDVDMLLEAGANPNVQSANGETPLHRAACRRGYHEIVKSLLIRADPTIRRADGKTAIELAMQAGGIEETMELFRGNGSSLATMVLGWESLKTSAFQSGTLLSRFHELTLGPKASAISEWTSNGRTQLTIDPDISISPETVHLETTAFTESVRRFNMLSNQILPHETVKIVPKRLIDVTTGKIVSGDNSMSYVIGSYLWSPQKTPGIPRDLSAYEPISETSQRVLEACKKYPDLIEMIPPEREGVSTLKYPAKSLYPSEPDSVYLTEVYLLLGREALRRGLRFVWLDSFCISQTDDKDKAEQIPLMADYYRNAECCVVVSESLRRHIRPEFDPSRKFFDSGDSITDRILGWATGFHFSRVWVLQETRLAKEVITRSGSVRIHTTEVLSQNFTKDSTDANRLWRHTVREWEPVNKTRNAINKACQTLPLSGSRMDGNEPISIDFCMMLLRDRDSLYRHDRIFGALGLFTQDVRRSLPIDYSLSLSAIFVIFVYLRIRSGNLIGLLSVRAPDQPRHCIRDGPSWLPSGYGFNYADILDLQTDPASNFRTESSRKLCLQMIFIRIADCYRLDDSVFALDPHSDHGNIILKLMNKDGSLQPGIRRAAVEPVDPDYTFTSDKSFGTNHIYVTRPPIKPTQLSASDALKIAEEREQRRLQIQVAARQDRAVVAMLGMDRTTLRQGFPLNTVWLILCSDEGAGTWRRQGIMVMKRERAECFVGSDGTECQEFCII